MGTYLNPGNSGFSNIRNGHYVDKSGLLHLINQTMNTPRKLTCISRPRRFGKSFAAQMLCAYYDKTCDSAALFDDLEIATSQDYREHLNRYDVIYLDMTGIIETCEKGDVVDFIKRNVTAELLAVYPALKVDEAFFSTLANAVSEIGNKFIMIIDEWDAPIREVPEIQEEYLKFLRSLFKNSGTTDKVFAAAYMTGILPIKKDGSQSAISDFKEFSMIKPRKFGTYVGFTEEEVKALCKANDADFATMKEWYDGYFLRDVGSVYNPNSVMEAIENDDFDSYWTATSAAESLMGYISMDYMGLSKTIAELLGGIAVSVDTNGFANDLVTFRNRDDVLTLLIHLGYLAYDEQNKTAYIPNEEIRMEFAKAIREVKNDETIRRVQESEQLILDTIHQKENAVAAQIEKIHLEETTPLFYNNEQALRSVIKLAYFSYKDYYIQLEELPSGKGFVDIIYLPKKGTEMPTLVIELKWNRAAEGAIAQIYNQQYPQALKDLESDILLVGINYDEKTKKHTCKIETGRIDSNEEKGLWQLQ